MPALNGHMILSILGVAVLCGIIGLDRTAAGQFMVSQPIVAAPFTGWLLGDVTAGAVVGVTLELLWVLDLPVGSFVPADATVCSISATAIAALAAPGGADSSVIGFSLLLTVPMVPVTMRADSMVRSANSYLVDAVLNASGVEMETLLSRAQKRGLLRFFIKSVALCCVFIPLGLAAVLVFRHLPGFVPAAMSSFVKLAPLIGVASIARKLSILTVDRMVIAGFAVAICLSLLVHAQAPVVLLFAAGAGWIGAVYRERRT